MDPVPQQIVKPAAIDRQEDTAEPPLLDRALPQIEDLSAKGTMSKLVPFPASGTTLAILNQRYPKQNNQSPFLTPQNKINPESLVDGYNMTPLNHLLPGGAMLDQLCYAEQNTSRDDDQNDLGNIDVDSKDGDYKYHGDVDDDDSDSNSPATEAARKAIGGGN